jgi:hypothetical protein
MTTSSEKRLASGRFCVYESRVGAIQVIAGSLEREESPSSIGQNASQRLVGATPRKVPQKIYRRSKRPTRLRDSSDSSGKGEMVR